MEKKFKQNKGVDYISAPFDMLCKECYNVYIGESPKSKAGTHINLEAKI